MRFGLRGSAKSAAEFAEMDESQDDAPIDPEFEAACLDLAMSGGLKEPLVPEPARVVEPSPERVELVEPAEPVESVVAQAPAPQQQAMPQPVPPTAIVDELQAARSAVARLQQQIAGQREEYEAKLAAVASNASAPGAADAEVDALRRELVGQQVRHAEDVARLEDEVRRVRGGLDGPGLGDSPAAEVAHLEQELARATSRHADDIARWQSEAKAASAKHAEAVIAAQLAQDELTAVRAELREARDHVSERQADLEAADGAFNSALRSATDELATARAEAQSLRQMLDESRRREADLAEQLRGTQALAEVRADDLRKLREVLLVMEGELAATQQELLAAEMRRAEEAASFLDSLKK